MILEWCAMCLAGHSQASASLRLTEADGNQRLIDPWNDIALVREAAGVLQLRTVTGLDVALALTTYAGTPVCAFHLDEEFGRRRR